MALSTTLFLYVLLQMLPVNTVSPEAFGAVGDGISDDSPAFNRCISEGLPVVLAKGKSYRLKTALNAIHSESFELRGNGARLIVDENYPMNHFTHLFRFDVPKPSKKSFAFRNVTVEYLPGQKFEDSLATGDSYFIFVDNCDDVVVEGIEFNSPSLYNNLTFFATFGSGRFYMNKCDVRINTLSRQGGIVWVMNRFRYTTDIIIKDCRFEHDTMDECVCFSAIDLDGIPGCTIRGDIRRCDFRSPCDSPSSGFMMAYHHFPGTADIKLDFRRCVFTAKGDNGRKIMSYQTGPDKDVHYATINTRFVNCRFDYEFGNEVDTGLLSLPFVSSRPSKDFLFSFRRCRFSLKGVHPIIGDRDGNKSGCYEFRNCRIDSESDPFRKVYNIPTSKIYISLNNAPMTRLQ